MHDIGDDGDGAVDVGFVDEQRGEAAADDVGRAEIADDAAGDHGLHDGIAFGVAERDLTAAHRVIAGGGKDQAGAACLDACDIAVGQGQRGGAQGLHIDAVPDIERGFEGGQLQDGRCADAQAFSAGCGAVVEIKGKGGGVALPA